MALVPPNIIPENNLRLPDALTVKYGPAQPLARFLLGADKAARRKGVSLRIRHDFDELLRTNEAYTERGIWYPLLNGFNPKCAELKPENSVWVSGEDENGEIAVTAACRIFNWCGTSLAEQARTVWYGRDLGQACVVTAKAAVQIVGTVGWGGASWVRPDFRGRHLSYLIPRVLKAYVASRWPVDWIFCFIGIDNVRRGLAASYGYKNLSHSVFYPSSPHGEQVIAYTRVSEFYEELTAFMAAGESIMEAGDFEEPSLSSVGMEHIVTNTSSDEVLHGNINRS
jgi:hypothetical protein